MSRSPLVTSLRLGGLLLIALVVVLIGAAMLGAERLPLFDLTEQQADAAHGALGRRDHAARS